MDRRAFDAYLGGWFNFLAMHRSREDWYEVVSGGASGIDVMAVDWAQLHGRVSHVIKADWGAHGKKAGVLRNQQIVDMCEHVIAFWDGQSRGTRDTINRTLVAGKLLTVVPIRLKQSGPSEGL